MNQDAFAAQCRDVVLRNDFNAFIEQCFNLLNPAQSYSHNWHIELVAQTLEACRKGDITRLIINMPPRSLKSVCVSVAWPAWILAHQPHKRIMAASYAQSLSEKHSLDCRTVMQSGWYRRLFPATQLSRAQNEKHKFITSQQGMRLATSVLGAATGEGGDILIADDIINPLQAMSRTSRDNMNGWFEHTFASRLNNKRQGCIVVVMQRLHCDDISGLLLRKGGWEHLCLPAIAPHTQHWVINGREWRVAKGDLLHPAREDAQLVERARQELGSAYFAAQYLQQPLSLDGGMVKLAWFARY